MLIKKNFLKWKLSLKKYKLKAIYSLDRSLFLIKIIKFFQKKITSKMAIVWC